MALIITIIVMLILAGVVINMTLGNDGIIAKAQTAVGKYQNAQEKEDNTLMGYEDQINVFGAVRDAIPVMLDENEHEIGVLGNKKLYQKTFLNREINITTTNRTWYIAIDNDELSELNIDTFFIDEGNSFIKMVYTKGTYAGQEASYPISYFSNNGEFVGTNATKMKDGRHVISQVWSGFHVTNDDTEGIHYYNTITIKYTKK